MIRTDRRWFLLSGVALAAGCAPEGAAAAPDPYADDPFRRLTDAQWRERLSPEAYRVLRREGTEAPFSSPLNDEKRAGLYLCAGCRLPLFRSAWKYDSGTGWPSFFRAQNVRTKRDFKLVIPRTEYHCARCLGHQGHVFSDGPAPTGRRWCNNGAALVFAAA